MPVTFKGQTAAPVPTSPVANNTVPVPAGVQNDDFLLLFGANTGSWPYFTPDGWNLLDQAHDDAGPNGDQTGAVFWRIASSEPASYTLVGNTAPSGGSASATVASMLAYSGVDTSSPIRSHTIKETGSSPVTSVTPNSLSSVDATDLVVIAYGYGCDTRTTGRTLSYPTTGSWNQRGIVGPTQIGGTGGGRFAAGLLFIDKVNGTDLPSVLSNFTGGWSVMSIALKASPPTSDMLGGPRLRKIRHLLVR
jgi:hypothetical protein